MLHASCCLCVCVLLVSLCIQPACAEHVAFPGLNAQGCLQPCLTLHCHPPCPPQINTILPMLKRGIGVHHSGLLPIVKEVIELLFQEGLIKVGGLG